MASKRKFVKSKFITEDLDELSNISQFINSPKDKKKQKLTPNETFEGESRIKTEQVPSKNRMASHVEATQKLFNIMDQHLTKRKKSNENLLTSLSDIFAEMKTDDDIMTENEQNLKQIIGALLKCVQETMLAYKQKLQKLEELHSTYKSIFEQSYSEDKSQGKLVTEELNDDINKLQEKITAKAKRSGYDAMGKNIIQAIENGFLI